MPNKNMNTDEMWLNFVNIFTLAGDLMYGEAVTERSHAVQAGLLAEEARAPDAVVVAALLHDIGHLLHSAGEDIAEKNVDMKHEVLGEQYLLGFFLPRVCRPVGLHVAAKRYLAAVKSDYLERLSPASLKSLELQGGAMSADEVEDFKSNEFSESAVLLRYCDEDAKQTDIELPSLLHFEAVVKRELLAKQLTITQKQD